MNITKACFLILAGLLSVAYSFGQRAVEPEKAGRMEDGKFILRIDLDWDEAQISRFAELFDLDSIVVNALKSGQIHLLDSSSGWQVLSNQSGVTEISRILESQTTNIVDKILFSALPETARKIPAAMLPATVGVNDFSHLGAFKYQNNQACFTLHGNTQAKQVYLSGSFNQWSTMELPMQRTEVGWTSCIQLQPGKYHYKYIVDGRWMPDPANRKRDRDGHRSYNSVAFCYNYVFSLPGYQNARRVVLTGSFNNWNTREMDMTKTPDGWELPLYLREGTHAYKFIVDGRWITDPVNQLVRDDGRGNTNSFMAIGDTTFFTLTGFEEARQVFLAGSFNAWNPGELPMQKTSSGWELPYVLAPGNYEYKYIVDGQWMPDPDNPYATGSGDFTNSFVAYEPTHVFAFKGSAETRQVIVSGSFNGWSREIYRMAFKNGQWIFPIHLPPGRHRYKYIVDGEWIMDPANPLWEENEFRGDGNSVIWID